MTVTEIELQLRSHDATWDYARWEQLPDDGNRYEVICGVLYMSTSPGMPHQWSVKRLTSRIGEPIEQQGLFFWFFAPTGLVMPGCDPVQPDFFLLGQDHSEDIHERGIRGVPELIAEVLSPSNPELDTVVKRSAYARAGVPEFWILRPVTREVLLLWEPDAMSGDYRQLRTLGPNEELVSPTLPIRIRVADLFEAVGSAAS